MHCLAAKPSVHIASESEEDGRAIPSTAYCTGQKVNTHRKAYIVADRAAML